ncbi:isocitrate lyase/phosphoenolpyruvate mutase family protein [Salipaludibacillus agaradhaerens]|jgi:phosphoenolpyruvate phosphomutase|uniref:isocitrate lyase/phosphoenolpyruvate mutase family protein n=1 Tax=Salipaludibacillus agaradhaerens TaxID=76935 RepID=UPI000997A422|nr:isocitrate lyase/phosphoenolpyruvate mutase family protein [Salipaludibacillus agaradhaerens]MCR6105465.1 isocitrate lyase/phosphoenolpyruvate mutase family protein [Salipaludibacillus agaradhaerens]MCR6109550.1 isocitrate lyase/phosphoenolpyruvate mutase family protein [Bacillus sp. A301a_S52]MCR6117503.1 isocitrate lyase/phosphoenolpyruvate mutase family protein [Salipaludibacillus agaradhaerens]UJW56692.1 isocitrate lyase/phosphoenolpyruvate mutase family protein [Bacillus sp. A116_S68]
MKPRHLFRHYLNNPDKLIRTIGAHDAISAKIAEKNGFEAIWASGFEISASHGKPDANILTMTEFLRAAEMMVEAVNIPVIADCDSGFGNVNNVIEMVKKYEKAGITGICLEDKLFPKVNSFINKRQKLADKHEFAAKIKAAKNTQVCDDFVVIARVEALIAGLSIEEAIERAEAYEEAGADMILIHSKKRTSYEIEEFRGRWKSNTPIVIVPTTYPSLTEVQIKQLKIKMVIYANQGLRSAIKAMNNTLFKLGRSGSLEQINNDLESMESIFELQGMNNMLLNEEKYDNYQAKQLSKT